MLSAKFASLAVGNQSSIAARLCPLAAFLNSPKSSQVRNLSSKQISAKQPKTLSFLQSNDRFLKNKINRTVFASLSTQPFSDYKSTEVDGDSKESSQLVETEETNTFVEETKKDTKEDSISNFLKEHEINVVPSRGQNAPEPVLSFQECDLPDFLANKVLREFSAPTPIQAQALPIALEGQNMVGIGKTGSGKTLAFLLPAFAHIHSKQKNEKLNRRSLALVLAPTRELAKQIEEVAFGFRKSCGINTVCFIGGDSKGRQLSQYDRGPQLIIATPGRLNDFLESGEVSISDVSYVVLDEADRMLDMGFEPQIRGVLEHVKKERQMLMFSATWPEEVRELAKDFLGTYTFMQIGSANLSANKNIVQEVEVCDDNYKMEAFLNKMVDIGEEKTLVFTERKATVDRLERLLRSKRVRAMGIHGDKTQQARSAVISRFKDGSCNVMVATDVAARGLDINDVLHVVNYDFPQDIENYIHRIGRTGRVNKQGRSFSLVTRSEGKYAKNLIKVLKESGQEVNPELYELMKSARHEKSDRKQNRYNSRESSRYQQQNRYGNKPRYQSRGNDWDEEDGGGYNRKPRYQSRGLDGDEEDGGGYNRKPRYQSRGLDGDDEEWAGGYNRKPRYNDRSSRGAPRRSGDYDDWESRHKGPSLE